MGTRALSPPPQPQAQPRQCWICYETDEDEVAATGETATATTAEGRDAQVARVQSDWIRPCACRGSSKWVHESCLLNWIDLKTQQGSADVRCPQCQRPYTFSRGEPSLVMAVGDTAWVVFNVFVAPNVVLLCNKTAEIGFYSFYGAMLDEFVVGHDVSDNVTAPFVEDDFDAYVAEMIKRLAFSLNVMVSQDIVQHGLASVLCASLVLVVDKQPPLLLVLTPLANWFYKMFTGFVYAEILVQTTTEPRSRVGAVVPVDNRMQQVQNRREVANANAFFAALARWYNPNRIFTLISPFVSSILGTILFGRMVKNQYYRSFLGGCVMTAVIDGFRLAYAYSQQKRVKYRRILPYRTEDDGVDI